MTKIYCCRSNEIFQTKHEMMPIKPAILDVRILGLDRVSIPPPIQA